MAKLAMASFTPISFFCEMTIDELSEWAEVIAETNNAINKG